jgi:hybrid cluster-associated redox disulfide protein
MKLLEINSQTSMAEIMASSPRVVRLIIEKHMDCPGCAMASFCSLEDACKIYNLAIRKTIEEFQAAP